ncbi:hypothetical protein RCL1_003754 [Eukaryota sp. TZLM3-RCL]
MLLDKHQLLTALPECLTLKTDPSCLLESLDFLVAIGSALSNNPDLVSTPIATYDTPFSPMLPSLVSKYGLRLFQTLQAVLDHSANTIEPSFQSLLRSTISALEADFLILSILKTKHGKLCAKYYSGCRTSGTTISYLSWLLFSCCRRHYRCTDFHSNLLFYISSFYLTARTSSFYPSLSKLIEDFSNYYVSVDDFQRFISKIEHFLSFLEISAPSNNSNYKQNLLNFHSKTQTNFNFNELDISIIPIYDCKEGNNLQSKVANQTGLFSDDWLKFLNGSQSVSDYAEIFEVLNNSLELSSQVEKEFEILIEIGFSCFSNLEKLKQKLFSLYFSFLSKLISFEKQRSRNSENLLGLIVSKTFSRSLFFVSTQLVLENFKSDYFDEILAQNFLKELNLTPIDLLPVLEVIFRSCNTIIPVGSLNVLKKIEHKILTTWGFLPESLVFSRNSNSAFKPICSGSGDGRIDFFIRRVLIYGFNQLKHLCSLLKAPIEISEQIFCILKTTVTRHLDLIKNLHLDVVILVTFYSHFQLNSSLLNEVEEINFESLLEAYQELPYSNIESVKIFKISDQNFTFQEYYEFVFDTILKDLSGFIPSHNSTPTITNTPFQGNSINNLYSAGQLRTQGNSEPIKKTRVLFQDD